MFDSLAGDEEAAAPRHTSGVWPQVRQLLPGSGTLPTTRMPCAISSIRRPDARQPATFSTVTSSPSRFTRTRHGTPNSFASSQNGQARMNGSATTKFNTPNQSVPHEAMLT